MHYGRKTIIATVAVAVLLGVSIWWGYGQFRLNRTYTIRLENNYQRAFHELVWHMQTVENELAKLSVASSAPQCIEKLSTTWRQIYAAGEKVGQLPLGLVELDDTESYLTRAGDYLFSLVRQGGNLSPDQRRQLQELRQSAAAIGSELATLQSTILQRNLKWTDVEAALVKRGRQNEVQDNTVIDNFQLVNRQVQEFPEIKLDQRIGVVAPPPTALTGPKVTQAQAQETALWFLSPGNKAAWQVVAMETTNGLIPTYSFVLRPSQGNGRATVDITQQDGRVLFMLDNRTPAAEQIVVQQAISQADIFLRERGFTNMRLIGQDRYQGTLMLSYVYVQDGVLIYPDLLRVRVALDNGMIIGFEGNGYTAYHVERRDLSNPGISIDQALSRLARELEVIGAEQLAIVFNAQGRETLVYEIPARYQNDRFLIYVDATKGEEVQIVRLEPVNLPAQPAMADR